MVMGVLSKYGQAAMWRDQDGLGVLDAIINNKLLCWLLGGLRICREPGSVPGTQ